MGNKYYLLASLAFLLIAAYFFFAYWHFTPENFGYSLVSVEVPYKGAFFYAKPITYITVSLFLFYAFFLKFMEEFFKVLSKQIRFVLIVFFFLFALLSLHELIWQSIYWSAKAIAINASVDSEFDSITFPPVGHLGNRYPTNIIYVNRFGLLYFGISIYAIYFLHKIDAIARKES